MTSTARFDNWQNRLGTQAGSIDASGNVTFDNDVTVSGGATVSGDLTVTGNMTSANQGLVFIKSQEIIGTPTSITVTNVFSSSFDVYRIILEGTVNSTFSQPIYLRFGTGATYYMTYWDGSTTTTVNGGSDGVVVTGTGTGGPIVGFEATVCNPNASTRKTVRGNGTFTLWQGGGQDTDTTPHTGFTIHAGGTITFSGGTIRVYGYSNG